MNSLGDVLAGMMIVMIVAAAILIYIYSDDS